MRLSFVAWAFQEGLLNKTNGDGSTLAAWDVRQDCISDARSAPCARQCRSARRQSGSGASDGRGATANHRGLSARPPPPGFLRALLQSLA